jgi:cbb3-type cytochrome oxidase cytochrome c subunit
MPWHPAVRKDARQVARQAASFSASRANSSFKMDVEEITAVIAYVQRRKQKLKKKLWVHPFVAIWWQQSQL